MCKSQSKFVFLKTQSFLMRYIFPWIKVAHLNGYMKFALKIDLDCPQNDLANWRYWPKFSNAKAEAAVQIFKIDL